MKPRILIVDDDKLLNRINEKVLLGSGLVEEVHIVSNGLLALEYLLTRIAKGIPLPGIIILDLGMPVMNGFDFIDEFAKLDFHGKSKIQLVVFTSSSNPRDQERVHARGIRH